MDSSANYILFNNVNNIVLSKLEQTDISSDRYVRHYLNKDTGIFPAGIYIKDLFLFSVAIF